MKMFYILSLALISACGKGTAKIEPDLKPTYEFFIQASIQNGHDLSGVSDITIQYGDPGVACNNKGAMGCCQNGSVEDALAGRAPIITILSGLKTSSSEAKKIFLYHELGHCLLHRKHDQSIGADGAPESLMYAYALGVTEKEYAVREQKYLHELFSGAQTNY